MTDDKILKRNRCGTIRANSVYTPSKAKRIAEAVVEGELLLKEIVRKEGISVNTYYRWLRDYPEFADMIKNAERDFDNYILDTARTTLKKQITGFKVKSTKKKHAFINPTPDQEKLGNKRRKILIEQVDEVKEVLPSTQAVIFALTARDPHHWQNRSTSEITGAGGAPLIPEKPLSRKAYAQMVASLTGMDSELVQENDSQGDDTQEGTDE